jgi:hypothetical protein
MNKPGKASLLKSLKPSDVVRGNYRWRAIAPGQQAAIDRPFAAPSVFPSGKPARVGCAHPDRVGGDIHDGGEGQQLAAAHVEARAVARALDLVTERLTPHVSRHKPGQVYFPAEARAMTRENVIQRLQQEQAYLAAEFGVRKIGLFGSFARKQEDEASDIDLVVELERPLGFRFLELVDYLEAVLDREVDVLTPAGIENIRIAKVAQSITESLVYV